MKTAKALSLTIPQSILPRADYMMFTRSVSISVGIH
jgi:hypothetical protein